MATKQLQDIVNEAEQSGARHAAAVAALRLGVVERKRRRSSRARESLEMAASIAMEEEDADLVFNASFELYLLTQATDATSAARFLRRCERYYPLVQARSARVSGYERVLRQDDG